MSNITVFEIIGIWLYICVVVIVLLIMLIANLAFTYKNNQPEEPTTDYKKMAERKAFKKFLS
ncbi:hypothetical protein [Listeria costaricensis]|uniref:hypothetical protein n=1 Tax=Listeria costaricensis TaxID=2026604 RepID=UPI000C0799BA|nr:hypothetical protein [Listeria costaricensis]